MWGRQSWPRKEFCGAVIIEPAFTFLEACNNRVAGILIVLRGMLVRRVIAAANVSAFGAPAEVQPPAVLRQALDATRTARFSCWINTVYLIVHVISASYSESFGRLDSERCIQMQSPSDRLCERIGSGALA
jgi:hypothetical protein